MPTETPTLEPQSWDLSALFTSIEDPKVDTTWNQITERSKRFNETYKGKIESAGLDAQTLLAAIQEYEAINNETSKPVIFGFLKFAADTSDPKHGAFLQKQQEKATESSVLMIFFPLELQKISDAKFSDLLATGLLDNYRHFLKVARTYTPHSLTEPEERIFQETDNTGANAWGRLFEELTSNQVFKLKLDKSLRSEVPGFPEDADEKELSQGEVMSLFRNSNREIRQAAANTLSAGLKDMERTLVFLYNNLLQDKSVKDRLRNYGSPEESRHLANELDKPTVDLVMEMCKKNYTMVERFYHVKREILGLPELTHLDRYAPLFETEGKIPYADAKDIVLDSFAQFSQEMSDRAREFFDKDWIDSAPRKGKQGGAFCCGNTPDTHPVILQSYLGTMNDVMTLAHELGHGVHASFSRKQTMLNFHGTLPLAELASTFAEMLVFEKLVAKASLKDKVAMYAEKIEGIFGTIFRQCAMFEFERRCHAHRRENGELTKEEFGNYWQTEHQKTFGNALTLGEQHRNWWQYVGHFIGSPFYVYAYSFGELLVLSLYQMAKQEGPAFADKYTEMLSSAGSKTPFELMEIVGVDLRSEQFWIGGFQAIETFLSDFETLWGEYKKQ